VHKRGRKENMQRLFNAMKRVYTAQSAFSVSKGVSVRRTILYHNFQEYMPFCEVQESAGPDSPDYAFFEAQKSIDNAHQIRRFKVFFQWSLAIGEVKRWDVELDRFDKEGTISEGTPAFKCGCIQMRPE
jgi:hypothetical protein